MEAVEIAEVTNDGCIEESSGKRTGCEGACRQF